MKQTNTKKTTKHISPSTKAALLLARQDGATYKQLSERFGINSSSVYHICRLNGLIQKRRNTGHRTRLDDDLVEQIANYYKGHSRIATARKFACDPKTVTVAVERARAKTIVTDKTIEPSPQEIADAQLYFKPANVPAEAPRELASVPSQTPRASIAPKSELSKSIKELVYAVGISEIRRLLLEITND